MNRVNLLLPVDSYILKKQKKINVSMLRIKKNDKLKSFEIYFLDSGKLIEKYLFDKMTIKVTDANEVLTIEFKQGKEVITVVGRKFIDSKNIKSYIRTLLI